VTQQIFRRADIAGAVEAPTVAVPGGGGGGGFGLQNIESIVRQFEGMEGAIGRFLDLMERFSNQYMKMKGYEAGSAGLRPGDEEHGGHEPLRTMEPPASPMPPPQPVQRIDFPDLAQKVYSLALGSMAQLPQDMNIAEALMMAREKKDFILPVIEGELKKLLE